MGLFDRIKLPARLDSAPAQEPSRELGDLIEPGSVEVSGMPAVGTAEGAAGLDQLKELQAAGLIDADTLKTIESTMADASAQLDQLHASGVMSDEIYAQAMASMAAATSGAGTSVDCTIAALHPGGDLKVGDFLRVRVDPEDPMRVAIDWSGLDGA